MRSNWIRKKKDAAPDRLNTPLPAKWRKRFDASTIPAPGQAAPETDDTLAELVVMLSTLVVMHGPN